jgi:hypothetical protein
MSRFQARIDRIRWQRETGVRPEKILNSCVAALRLEGCGPESIAFMLAEGAVEALTAAGLRGESFDGGVEHLVGAMREHAAALRAARLSPARPPVLSLVGGEGA